MEKAKFKIGDKVKVTNYGYTYTTYEEMFELMGFEDTQYNGHVKNKEVGIIFGVTLHEDRDTILYAIRTSDDREALIGEEGLIKIEDAPKMYSEEQLLDIIKDYDRVFKLDTFSYTKPCSFTIEEWFEQSKNK